MENLYPCVTRCCLHYQPHRLKFYIHIMNEMMMQDFSSVVFEAALQCSSETIKCATVSEESR